ELNAKIADTIIESIPLPIPVQEGNSQQEEIDIVTETDDVLPPSVENDSDDYDPLLGEADLFLSDNSIPPGIENFADDPEGDIHFLEELLINDSILSHESFDSRFEDNPLISRPPPEPPDNNFDLEPEVIPAVMEDIDEPDEHFKPEREINVSTYNEDVDYFPFMFVIRIFLPYLMLLEISPLLLSAESEDTIFDPEYDQSTRTDRPIFLNDNEDHPVQNKKSPENSFEETVVSKTNQEPPHDSDIHQLIEECSIEFLCIHDNVDNRIESALDSKLLSINLINSQRLDKKEQEVKNVEEQPAGRRNRAEKSLQNSRVIHKSSISFKNTSQISSIHSIAPIQSTKEPEHLLSMGKCDFTLEDEIECDMPAKDDFSPVFTTFSNPLFKDNDDLDSSDDESLPDEDVPAEEFKIYSNHLFDEDEINFDKLDSHCFNELLHYILQSVDACWNLVVVLDSNELIQKLLKDLKELAEYDQSTRTDRPIFLNDNENHLVQNKESPENSSEETVVSKTNQQPPQDSNIHQLIEECSIEVPEEQKQKMENTMFDLVKICHHKQFLCIHDNVDNRIESALDSKLLLINLINSQQDEIECDMPAKDDCSLVFTTFSNPLFKDNDDLDSSDDESLPDEDVPAEEFKIYSNHLFDEDEINFDKLDPHCFNVESDFVESLLNRDTFMDFSSKFDFSCELAHIKPEIPKSDFDFEEEIRVIENLLYDNSFPRLPEELNAEIANTIIESIPLPIPVQDGNSQQEEIDIVTKTDDVLPPSVENDNDDYDPLLGEADLFLSDNSIPPGIENFADDPEGDIHFLEELLIDDSIIYHESFDSSFEDNPSISCPPPEPPDDNFDLEPEVISALMEDIDEPDEHFKPGREINVSTNNEYVDYFPFMFVIRIFLPYLILLEISPLRKRIRSLILVSQIRSSNFSLGWNSHLHSS
nr:hypothetical protein [Tanacetum cinerariifolium]